MKFSEFVLNENSLYTNSTEKEEFLKNKEAVMNALIFNFFGFLGLFKLNDSSEYLKTYKRTEGSVMPTRIGNGIYFTNTLDKAAQYASDNGYTRKRGERGYIFQMEALLGEENKNYKAAGLGGDGIVSPEWCVFDPNRQLKIYKAFEVEIIDKKEMDELKQKHNINENTAVKLISFKEFIKESEDGMNVTTYVFMDGLIPISNNDVVDFEEFNPAQFGDHVWVETSQSGPMICIKHNGQESEAFCVRNTSAFMRDTKELDKFLSLLRKR